MRFSFCLTVSSGISTGPRNIPIDMPIVESEHKEDDCNWVEFNAQPKKNSDDPLIYGLQLQVNLRLATALPDAAEGHQAGSPASNC